MSLYKGNNLYFLEKDGELNIIEENSRFVNRGGQDYLVGEKDWIGRLISIYLLLLFVCISSSCEKLAEIKERDYPRILTLDVKNVSASGAEFSADIVTSLEVYKTYYVRSFIETTDHLVCGNAGSFKINAK